MQKSPQKKIKTDKELLDLIRELPRNPTPGGIFESLVDKLIDVNYTDKANQRSILHWAMENHRWSDLSIISNVLQKKGNPNLRDKYGRTALH